VIAVRQAPLSSTQERFRFMERLVNGIPLYNSADAYRLRGSLDAESLRRAIGWLVDRHEILRTRFPSRGFAGVQEVLDGWRPDLGVTQVDVGQGEDAGLAVRAWASELAARRFELDAEPGFRVGLAELGPDDHALLLVHHHIGVDGWSRGVLAADLAAAYAAFRHGNAPDLPPLSFQYADYAAWQRERIGGERGIRHRAFWKAALDGAPTDLDLPADRQRPPKSSYRGRKLRHTLPEATRAAMDGLARSERATPFMALLTAFQALISRYTDREDFLVGVPVSGRRDHPGVDALAGPFVNTMVLRADVSGDPDSRTLLRRVRASALRALPHQEFPFEEVVEEIGPERSLSQNPLFQVLFNYRSYPGRTLELEGLECKEVRLDLEMSELDLSLSALAWRPGALRLEWEYAVDRFDEATIERMACHLERLVHGMVTDPDRPVSELPILSDEELRAVLSWGRSDEPLRTGSIVSGIRDSAMAERDALAIASARESVTYGELWRGSSAVAAALRTRGIGVGSIVAVSQERTPALFGAILGVLASGAAYLPLDPSLPDERLRYLIEDSGVALVLSDDRLRPRIEALGAVVVSSDQGMADEGGEFEDPAGERDLAYLIYTSGSTGRPKGVQIERGPMANFVRSAADVMDIAPGDRVLQFCSIGFDVSVMEIFPTLLRGATLILRDPGPPPAASAFGPWMEEQGISVAILPTAYWHLWAAEVARAGTPALPKRLRLVVALGEKALAGPYAGWREVAPSSARWMNGYGPTEGTVMAMVFEPDPRARWDPEVQIPILGRPIAGSRVYVLDRKKRPAPIGVAGELHLGGPGITRGYLGAPERTAERITEDPFEAGGRVYQTGDRARWEADGRLQFLGRTDDQLKIRGYRVEPAEIESVLAAQPGVGACAVVAREVGGSKILVAYVSPPSGESLDPAELKERLSEQLPDYMLPGVIEVVCDMPLTASGKIDRCALPALQARPVAGRHVAPRTPAQRVLAGIWERLLGIERVGLHDDFFELGGHSLIALEVVAEAERAFGRSIPLSVVFEASVLEDLAAVLGNGADAPARA
jgi:amino acid adenylation domain-containing protein